MEKLASSHCWCGATEVAVYFQTKKFSLLRCCSCGCYRNNPPPVQSHTEAEKFYTQYYESEIKHESNCQKIKPASRFWRVVEKCSMLKIVQNQVLDVGCGEGGLSNELKRAGWHRVSGIDISKTRIARAEKKYPGISFYSGDIEATDIPLCSQDLIILDNVVEHLPDPSQTLTSLRGYLQKEGRLVLITPNMNSGHFKLLGRFWTPELAPHAHVYLFTANSLQRLLVTSGFTIEANGNFHLPCYSLIEWFKRLMQGDLKGFVWRGVQELGGLWGRVIGQGPMIYVVAKKE